MVASRAYATPPEMLSGSLENTAQASDDVDVKMGRIDEYRR
jgi:hypothetical protein